GGGVKKKKKTKNKKNKKQQKKTTQKNKNRGGAENPAPLRTQKQKKNTPGFKRCVFLGGAKFWKTPPQKKKKK
ncbi:hypothetical protein, partial [Escherichia coli]|uniref:hypothetical protein n=1 Tax=Escherichia coli TaxID=562 RepID=UPI0021E82C0B